MKVNTFVVAGSEQLEFDALVVFGGVADKTLTLQLVSGDGKPYMVTLHADTVTELLDARAGVRSPE